MKALLRRAVQRVAGAAGMRVERKRPSTLERLARLGLAPATVIDVGAAYGDWTVECLRTFPSARALLVEPLAEFAELLAARQTELGDHVVVNAAAAREDGEATVFVHADLVGSSMLLEREEHDVDGAPRAVPSVTVDTAVRNANVEPPFLLKLDVQGAELQVLEGARETLRRTEAVILEVTFFDVFSGGTVFHELVDWMQAAGFVVYDIDELLYRPLDGALIQANFAFVPKTSTLRARHAYAASEQRAAQDARMRADFERRRSALRR